MESVLHIQPMAREIRDPLSVGHLGYVSIGNKLFEYEDDPLGDHAVQLTVGSPLADVHGSNRSHIPLVKTFEYMPDRHNPKDNVYLETIHYLAGEKHLVPIRCKIQGGISSGLRIAHLPSLNYIRQDLGGFSARVQEPRSLVVSEMIDKDSYCLRNKSKAIMDYVREDIHDYLSNSQITDVDFTSENLEKTAHKFLTRLRDAPHDIGAHNLRDLLETIDLEKNEYPVRYFSKDVIAHPLSDMARFMVDNPFDLTSDGSLHISSLANISHNPAAFQHFCNAIDQAPLTDFNVDVIFSTDDEIVFFHEHSARRRFAGSYDRGGGNYTTRSMLHYLINPTMLRKLLGTFLMHHEHVDHHVADIIRRYPVKFKFVKTIDDEACILLFEHNSSSHSEPLCGVYFDIALQSLAPVTVIPNTIYF